MGIECWCWAFSRNPKLASAEIFKHGDQTALRRGIDEAINRGDSDSAMRLRTRLLRETPKQERDDLWLHDVDRQLSKLSKAGRKKSRSFNQPRQRDPAVWGSLRRDFERLSDDELQRDPNNRRDHWLRVYAYDGEGEDFGRVLYDISSGLDQRFKGAFRRSAKKAGIALGPITSEDAIENWLSFVFSDSRKHKSDLLKFYSTSPQCESGFPTSETGIITRICEASALCCSRLEEQTLENGLAIARRGVAPSRVPERQKERGNPSPTGLSNERAGRRRSIRPQSPDERKRERVIFGAIQLKLRGLRYCSHLDSKNLLAPERWRLEGWPNKYSSAYKQSEKWRKRIQDEKHRFQLRYDNESPEAIIEGNLPTRSTRH